MDRHRELPRRYQGRESRVLVSTYPFVVALAVSDMFARQVEHDSGQGDISEPRCPWRSQWPRTILDVHGACHIACVCQVSARWLVTFLA